MILRILSHQYKLQYCKSAGLLHCKLYKVLISYILCSYEGQKDVIKTDNSESIRPMFEVEHCRNSYLFGVPRSELRLSTCSDRSNKKTSEVISITQSLNTFQSQFCLVCLQSATTIVKLSVSAVNKQHVNKKKVKTIDRLFFVVLLQFSQRHLVLSR